MDKLLTILLLVVLAIGLTTSVPLQHTFGASKTQKRIDKLISAQLPKKDWTKIQALNISLTAAPHTVVKVYNKTGTTPTPGPGPSGSCPIGEFNHSAVYRAAFTADTKTGGKEFQLMKDCKTELNLVGGDLWYTSSCAAWFAAVEKLGWTKNNSRIAVGNHDSDGSCIKAWLGETSTYNSWFSPGGKIQIVTINANTEFACGSAQYNQIKSWIEGSDAWYIVVMVHQPFATVKNNHHTPNGQFDCYQPLFKANHVAVVLQGHVHNYQSTNQDGVPYTVGPAGTHDTGSGLYTCDSTSFNGVPMKCIRDNGALFLDFSIVDSAEKVMKAEAVNLNGKVIDTFTKRG